MTTPLRLKSERVGRVKIAEQDPYLSVLVDTGVFHLDQEFDYALPEKMDLKPGQWVSVPFHGKNCLGLIVKRSSNTSVMKILPINRVAKGPLISSNHLKFYYAMLDSVLPYLVLYCLLVLLLYHLLEQHPILLAYRYCFDMPDDLLLGFVLFD